jgi:hypothetical protein
VFGSRASNAEFVVARGRHVVNAFFFEAADDRSSARLNLIGVGFYE